MRKAANQRRIKQNPHQGIDIPRSTKGACSELVAASDLLLKGYEVFRACSPCSCCDLIALKDGEQIQVEVKTGHYTSAGKLSYPQPRHLYGYDLLAIVVFDPNIEIIYQTHENASEEIRYQVKAWNKKEA